MRDFLAFLSVLCATQVHGIFDGACPRKKAPPGVLVLSPGSKLVLTCKGHVILDGVKVSVEGEDLNASGRESTSAAPTAAGNTHSAAKGGYHSNPEVEVSTVTGVNGHPGYADTASTASSPTTDTIQPTNAFGLLQGEYDLEAGEVDYEGDCEEEKEGEEESRVRRDLKSRPQWKWKEKTVGTEKGEGREVTFEGRESSLSLLSVRVTDSGKYACHHRGRERFSLKVIVADPPESPSLSCYKRSPSSKIRCEWVPQKPVTGHFNCSLIFNKRPSGTFHHLQCSYSSRRSRYWCALDHDEDELRTLHMAYLCVTSITGNVTSALLHFRPLNILKPDPPSDVRVTQVEGQETWLKVAWNFPASWKPKDRYYELIYEVKYRPLESSFYQEQIQMIKSPHSYTITDAMPGVQYMIQVRTKEEYDGQWSDWTTPVIASSWTAPKLIDEMITIAFPLSVEEGSSDDYTPDDPGQVDRGVEVSHHILWISGSFVLMSVILAAYIFRHKERLMSKLHRVSVIIQSGDPPQLPRSSPAAPEGQTLMTFTPPSYKEPPPSEAGEEEDENEEAYGVKETIEAMHFDNSSYFLVQRE